MLRFATIGSSSIVELFGHAVREVDEVQWVAAASRDAARAEAFAQANGAGRGAWIDELTTASDVDAVYIASPNALHHHQAAKLLAAGKHVLVEKSGAANAAEWADLMHLASRNGVALLESVRSVFDPAGKMIEAYVDSLGPIRQVAVHMCQRSRRYDNFLAGTVENIFKPEMAAGALMDLGVYCLHPLVHWMGVPRKVQATSVRLKNGIDGTTSMLLDYDGFTASVLCSKINNYPAPSVFAGEDAALTVDFIDKAMQLSMQFNGREAETLPVERPMSQQAYVLQAFARMAADPSLALPHQQDTLDTLTVMDEVRRQIGLRFPNDN